MISKCRRKFSASLGSLALSLIIFWAPIATAEKDLSTIKGLRLELNPQVGTGSMTSGDRIRHITGYGVAITKPWNFPWLTHKGLRLSPKIALENNIVNAQNTADGTKRISTYDNRVLSLGMTLGRFRESFTQPWDGLFVTAQVGRGLSKLTLDESTRRTFRQSQFSGITGTQWAFEVGSYFPLKEDFGISAAFVASKYRAEAQRARGTFEGEELAEDESLSLVSGFNTAQEAGLSPQVDINSYGAKLGIVFDF